MTPRINQQALKYFHQTVARDYVHRLCVKHYRRKMPAFQAMALFECEDVEQELWTRLFESKFKGHLDAFFLFIFGTLSAMCKKGIRRVNRLQQIPVSQLPEKQREYVERSFYGS